jgi:hypothetical protein
MSKAKKPTKPGSPFSRDNIAIIGGHQIPVARYARMGIWHVWLSYNRDYSAGTYLRLMPDGRVFSDTISADGTLSTGTIKGTADDPSFFHELHNARNVTHTKKKGPNQ